MTTDWRLALVRLLKAYRNQTVHADLIATSGRDFKKNLGNVSRESFEIYAARVKA